MFAYYLEGGRGRGTLHAPDAAQDRAALQAGGKSRSARVSVPEEILPSRAWVRALSLPFISTPYKILRHCLKIQNWVFIILQAVYK